MTIEQKAAFIFLFVMGLGNKRLPCRLKQEGSGKVLVIGSEL